MIFTCQVIGSLTLQWDSPLVPQIPFPAGSTVSTSRPPSFIVTLTGITGSGINGNITSTLQVNASTTFARNDTTVECRNLPGVTKESRFTVAGNNCVAALGLDVSSGCESCLIYLCKFIILPLGVNFCVDLVFTTV